MKTTKLAYNSIVPSMGSPKVPNAQPHLPMADEKKSIKNILIKPFQALFQKDKKKENARDKDKVGRDAEPEIPKTIENINVTPVTDLLEKIKKLDLEKEVSDNDDDEFNNFSYKIIKDEVREKRNDSHSSEDSGFVEKCMANDFDDEKDKVLVDSFKKLNVEEQEKEENAKKGKKLQTVVIPRAPIRTKTHTKTTHPYQEQTDSVFRQISQINRQTFSGGQVIVNSNSRTETCTDIEKALKLVDMSVTNFAQNSQQEQVDRWQIAQEYINEDQHKSDDILLDFMKDTYKKISTPIYTSLVSTTPTLNPVEEFSTTSHTFDYDIDWAIMGKQLEKPSIFLTPPRSENVPSPMSDSQASFYPTTDYALSPQTSSPMYNSDYEKYQDIPTIEDYPSCVVDNAESDKDTDKKKDREKSSMSMKQFKDLQKQIATDFSKKECCQMNRKSCKAVFEEHIRKLKMDDRKSLCYNIANMDFKLAYGVLHHALLNLSNDKDENMNLAIFSLICEKVLALKPLLFVDDFGLSILKLAVLRCYHKPLLTRYIVQCIRTVTRSEAYRPTTDFVFTEVDTLGDTLLIACARAGDEYAEVLSEIVRHDGDIPLFNIHHTNADGYTALHVCCAEHRASAPKTHILHVLLRHAHADLWKGDIKGGDSALHLAVNSANCDLTIVMILFQHIERKEWRKLAHVQNMSSVNPLEYARAAVKSTTRQNYPIEVLDFLKKCR